MVFKTITLCIVIGDKQILQAKNKSNLDYRKNCYSQFENRLIDIKLT